MPGTGPLPVAALSVQAVPFAPVASMMTSRQRCQTRPDVGRIGKMGFPDAELKIVSLVRYIDACEPDQRHRDCPFAVEREGKLTCGEECREVLSSLLRRGRPAAGTSAQSFDARQLRLSEIGSTPDVLWHTSSLLQVVTRVARSSPFLSDGSFNLRRHVDATSALGALGCRGLDPDKLVRRGLAKTLKLTLGAWLEGRARADDSRDNGEHFNQWREFFEEDATTGDTSPGRYIAVALYGQAARRLDGWLESASLDDLLRWRLPDQGLVPLPTEFANEDVELWTWVVEKFTQTYLKDWSLTSLQCEYRFVQACGVPISPRRSSPNEWSHSRRWPQHWLTERWCTMTSSIPRR